MKKILFLFLYIIIGTFAKAQPGVDWQLNGNNIVIGDFFGTLNNESLFTRTDNANRMKLNHGFNYAVNGGAIVHRTGNLLIGREQNVMSQTFNLYDPAHGAFSLLHLNGDGSEVQELGFRNWMQTLAL